jgi:ArsR family metal-binding transcriptional regulator
MPSDKVTIEFKDGKKITTYPGGKVTEQTKEDLERYKNFLTNEKQRINRHLSLIDDDLKQMVPQPKGK